jgi:hypothetical protein
VFIPQVRQQNAELMAAFHRREQLAAVQEDPEGERSSKGGASGAAAGGGGGGGLLGGTEGGSTPNTGSELGVSWTRMLEIQTCNTCGRNQTGAASTARRSAAGTMLPVSSLHGSCICM